MLLRVTRKTVLKAVGVEWSDGWRGKNGIGAITETAFSVICPVVRLEACVNTLGKDEERLHHLTQVVTKSVLV